MGKESRDRVGIVDLFVSRKRKEGKIVHRSMTISFQGVWIFYTGDIYTPRVGMDTFGEVIMDPRQYDPNRKPPVNHSKTTYLLTCSHIQNLK